MAGAVEGQRRPRLAESADLVMNWIWMRLRIRLRTSWAWEYRHRRLVVPVRVGTGIWLVVITAILYGYGRGGWWGVLLVPAAALHFYLAYRSLRHSAQS
jgi:hypothetical protein